jgi:hypothetical protein
MATVPSYGENRVEQAPIPGARLTTRSSPLATGAGLGQIADEVAGINARELAKQAQDERDKADEQAVFEVRRRLNEWELANIYDAKTGAVSKRGRDAINLPSTLAEKFDEATSDIEQNVTSERARNAVANMKQARRQQVLEWANRHESQQAEVFHEEQYQADVESSKERAVASLDPKIIAQEVQVQRLRIMGRMQDRGASEEAIAQELQKSETDTHARVIESMLKSGNDQAASGYFAKVSERMDPDSRAAITAALEEGSLRGNSQRESDTILAAGGDRAAMLAKARAITDPKLRDQVVDRVERGLAENERALAQHREELFDTAAKSLEGASGDLSAIAPADWVQMKPAQQSALRSMAKEIADGIEPKQDDTTWLAFTDLRPEEVAKLSKETMIERYKYSLDRAHWEGAMKQWALARDAVNSPQKRGELDDVLSFKDQVDNALRLGGIINKEKSRSQLEGPEVERLARFEEEAAALIERESIAKGKKLTGQERQSIIDDLLLKKVFVKEWGRDPQLPAAILSDADRKVAYVPLADIPKGDQADIEGLIRSKGRHPSKDKIQRIYAAFVMNRSNPERMRQATEAIAAE